MNEKEFLDVSRPFVRVDGRLGEDSIKEITMTPLNDIYVALRTNKIDELKETSGNRDFHRAAPRAELPPLRRLQRCRKREANCRET